MEANELIKLGALGRLRKLGYFKYILIVALLLIGVGWVEIIRYNGFDTCVFWTGAVIRGEAVRNYLAQHPEEDQTKSAENSWRIMTQKLGGNEGWFDAVKANAIAKCKSDYPFDIFNWFSAISPIGVAKAQMQVGNYSENEIKGIVIISIFFCMGVFFFLATGAILFSKNAKVVSFSMDSVKTLLGFFIGVAVSFMGMHSPK